MFKLPRNWSFTRIGLLILVGLPVLAAVIVFLNLAWNSYQAILNVGLSNLLSDEIYTVFSGSYIEGKYGLRPALLGSLMVALMTLAFAFPVSLAFAISASELHLGWLNRPIEILLSIFAGIPPIVYALLSLFVLKSFVWPKFTGIELAEPLIMTLPGLPLFNDATLPKSQSALLGCIFLALLIIPFMTPIILDAIRNVPAGLKEASYALGASQSTTIRRVVLPGATTGIISAVTLGLLKASGDVIISAWCIGMAKDNGMPIPIWDFFERNSPLPATAAGVMGGLGYGSPSGISFSVAAFAGLLLMIFAYLMLVLSNLVQKRLSRRYTG